MVHRRLDFPLLLGLLASAALHVALLVPWLIATMAARSEALPLESALPPDEAPRPAIPEPPEEPVLGIDAETPSSLTWIGYEEYEEHLAELAAFEQAAFTLDPVGVPEIDPTEPVIAEAPIDPAEALEPEPPELPPAEPLDTPPDVPLDVPTTEPPIELPAEPPARPEPAVELREESAPDSPVVETEPLPRRSPVEAVLELLRNLELPEMPHTDPAPELPAEQMAPEVPPEVPPKPEADGAESAEARDESAAAESPPRSAPPAGEDRPGEVSEKEADATSIIDMPPDNWRLGRPLAAQGIELKPQRPHFTLLQLMTASPRNPLVGVRFDHRGVPVDAIIIESTGERSVDAALQASLYRWRAEGEGIDALEAHQTFDVRIRIILSQRR